MAVPDWLEKRITQCWQDNCTNEYLVTCNRCGLQLCEHCAGPHLAKYHALDRTSATQGG